MTEENKAPEVEAEVVPPGEAPNEPPAAEWRFKKNMGINEEMKKIIHLSISATQSEIVSLKRKLDKLTYGA